MEIPLSPIKIQKQGEYYKIAIPPELVKQKIIKKDGIFEITLTEIQS